ncbi:hypothetical protein B0H10DRAFT_1787781 [Mycena sp. CBHHK59/15]|nr:hypothetical protein B0H10DRAFT_1787781 [Mycena sp. CBHHK59/15]
MSLQNSRFMDRLNTNFVPSDPELEEIRSFLTNPLNELARLDAQIADMHARRKMLTEMIDAHKALLSPMRRVPHDVLQEIFISCLPTDHNSLMDAREAPMILGHICSGWRRLALSTPMLWSSIHIPSLIKYSQSSIPSDFIPRCGELVQAWLDRSGNCSLSISNHDFTATETRGSRSIFSESLVVCDT